MSAVSWSRTMRAFSRAWEMDETSELVFLGSKTR